MSRIPVHQFYLRQPGNVGPDIQLGESPVTVGRGSCPNIKDKRVSTEHVAVNSVKFEGCWKVKVEIIGQTPCVINGKILNTGETGDLKVGETLHLLSKTDEGEDFPFMLRGRLSFKDNVPPVEETKSDATTTTVNNKSDSDSATTPSNNNRKKPMSIAQAKFLNIRGRDYYGYDYYGVTDNDK